MATHLAATCSCWMHVRSSLSLLNPDLQVTYMPKIVGWTHKRPHTDPISIHSLSLPTCEGPDLLDQRICCQRVELHALLDGIQHLMLQVLRSPAQLALLLSVRHLQHEVPRWWWLVGVVGWGWVRWGWSEGAGSGSWRRRYRVPIAFNCPDHSSNTKPLLMLHHTGTAAPLQKEVQQQAAQPLTCKHAKLRSSCLASVLP